MRLVYRPMKASDVVEGQKFIMIGDEGLYKGVIDEVRYPNDSFKAFIAEDGCRYGLDGSFIKIRKE